VSKHSSGLWESSALFQVKIFSSKPFFYPFFLTTCFSTPRSFNMWAAKPGVLRGVESMLPVKGWLLNELLVHVREQAREAAIVVNGDLLARFPSDTVHEELCIIDVR